MMSMMALTGSSSSLAYWRSSGSQYQHNHPDPSFGQPWRIRRTSMAQSGLSGPCAQQSIERYSSVAADRPRVIPSTMRGVRRASPFSPRLCKRKSRHAAAIHEIAPRQIRSELAGGAQAQKIISLAEAVGRDAVGDNLVWQRGCGAHFWCEL